jgi:hypothetical protein
MSEFETVYRISYRPDGQENPIHLGKLVLGADHMVKARAASPDFSEALKELEGEINDMPVLHVDDVPPNASPLESWVRIVERGTAEFPSALKTLLHERYDLIVE